MQAAVGATAVRGGDFPAPLPLVVIFKLSTKHLLVGVRGLLHIFSQPTSRCLITMYIPHTGIELLTQHHSICIMHQYPHISMLLDLIPAGSRQASNDLQEGL